MPADLTILKDPYRSDFRRRLNAFEGRIPWLYADVNGNPTVGVGHECPRPEDAIILGFTEDEWSAVKAAAPARGASYYAPLSTYRMSEQQMDELLDSDIDRAEGQLIECVPDVAGFPAPVKQALLDFAFDPGAHRLAAPAPRGWPRMMAAIRAGDYISAARESHRNGIQEARNRYVADLICAASGRNENA